MDQQGIDNLEGHLTTDTDDHYGDRVMVTSEASLPKIK